MIQLTFPLARPPRSGLYLEYHPRQNATPGGDESSEGREKSQRT